MSKMIERLALIIADDVGFSLEGNRATDLARAVIAAMREPTEAMLLAAEQESSFAGCSKAMVDAETRNTWVTMIDAALSEHLEG